MVFLTAMLMRQRKRIANWQRTKISFLPEWIREGFWEWISDLKDRKKKERIKKIFIWESSFSFVIKLRIHWERGTCLHHRCLCFIVQMLLPLEGIHTAGHNSDGRMVWCEDHSSNHPFLWDCFQLYSAILPMVRRMLSLPNWLILEEDPEQYEGDWERESRYLRSFGRGTGERKIIGIVQIMERRLFCHEERLVCRLSWQRYGALVGNELRYWNKASDQEMTVFFGFFFESSWQSGNCF
jgi:hypothetical protein